MTNSCHVESPSICIDFMLIFLLFLLRTSWRSCEREMATTQWDAFLGILAEKISVEPSHLPVASFEWHWLKPTSGPWLPVQDKNGFTSMIRKVKSKSEPYVIIRMQVLVKNKAAALDAVDELESDLEDNPVSKKVCMHSLFQLYCTYLSCRQS